ncbi:hypothetical protein CR103_20145 [Massilia psychrophila]|uniref:Uncharacterized protein n=2 Tax=Massilia psychrophila TaxID=1603353 RepID=A0A2G8SW64_9BURK|nr:hypothetical protein CR103_20145 [Massilia psychrophila]GGE91401.1 hypothetical protein GCM10008020_40480 [Massilia psychrophila]
MLLGDTMYMDYGIALLVSDRPVGWPRKLADETFATTMHERYKLQWSVKSFRDLLAGAVQLAMVWDDHDSAWDGLVVICSGSVMTGSEESWDKYVDYAWLLGLPAGHIIVL